MLSALALQPTPLRLYRQYTTTIAATAAAAAVAAATATVAGRARLEGIISAHYRS